MRISDWSSDVCSSDLRILNWYSQPSNHALPRAGLQTPNAWGVQDLHALVWEWTDDFSSLLVSCENGVQGEPDDLQSCGARALAMVDREDYAVPMRGPLRSSFDAGSTTANMGFHWTRDTR